MNEWFQELKAKYAFWRARKIKLAKEYDFFFNVNDTNTTAIKLLKKYPGVIIEYSNIEMISDQNMSFEFNVIANPNLCDVDSNKIKNYILHKMVYNLQINHIIFKTKFNFNKSI